jgi:hypothetical protein
MTSTRITWQERERSLMIGAPLVLLPAFAVLPTLAVLIYVPAFSYARLLGLALLAIYGAAEAAGIRKLADCVQLDFDVITFFAWGTIFILMVVIACVGVLMVGLVFRG